jgi:hypothetical protein
LLVPIWPWFWPPLLVPICPGFWPPLFGAAAAIPERPTATISANKSNPSCFLIFSPPRVRF